MREPVSTSAVPRIVSEPPSSILRAAPKICRGACMALESRPPDMVRPPLPDVGVVGAREARDRVEQQQHVLALDHLLRHHFHGVLGGLDVLVRSIMSLEAAITSAGVLRLKSVTSSGRSSTSSA